MCPQCPSWEYMVLWRIWPSNGNKSSSCRSWMSSKNKSQNPAALWWSACNFLWHPTAFMLPFSAPLSKSELFPLPMLKRHISLNIRQGPPPLHPCHLIFTYGARVRPTAATFSPLPPPPLSLCRFSPLHPPAFFTLLPGEVWLWLGLGLGIPLGRDHMKFLPLPGQTAALKRLHGQASVELPHAMLWDGATWAQFDSVRRWGGEEAETGGVG